MKGAPLLRAIRKELAAAADAKKAPAMQAYMKSEMPYHGCPTPVSRKIFKAAFADLPLDSRETWEELVRALWRGARFREERYAAIALASDKRARAWHTLDALPLFEEMITTGAWWDYVDEIAQHRVGLVLRNEPRPMKKALLAWSTCDDMWKRRTSIIAQNSFKKETDLALLEACIEPSLSSKEFFLRKAIGWALRQYAWTDPAWVVRYVRDHEDALSGLSKREALKNV